MSSVSKPISNTVPQEQEQQQEQQQQQQLFNSNKRELRLLALKKKTMAPGSVTE